VLQDRSGQRRRVDNLVCLELLAPRVRQDRKETLDPRVLQAPLDRLDLPDRWVRLVRLDHQVTKALWVSQAQRDLQDQRVHRDHKDHLDNQEYQDLREAWDQQDQVDFRDLRVLWVNKEEPASPVPQDH